MFSSDSIVQELFNVALKSEQVTDQALAALARAGRVAEVYLGPFGGQRLLEASRALDNSMSAETDIPSE